ncbi:hypothetical protein BDF22DRAFT_617019 [Syncephalis plumigaleata]|nr:hypothetical protein BDF22DRAFT_617019 [Syncephalis plumigaleata]
MPSIDSLSSFHADMYTPRKVKGEGRAKLGECPVCYEEGVSTWFRLKISSYWYHMNFYHGISCVTRRPYRNPVQIRKHRLSQLPESSNASSVSSGSSTEALSELHEGLCHNCDRWIAMDSIRHIAVKVPMIYWWKHAQQCHHLKKKKQN